MRGLLNHHNDPRKSKDYSKTEEITQVLDTELYSKKADIDLIYKDTDLKLILAVSI